MTETQVVKEVRVEASELGARMFRNNVGKLPDQNGRWVEFGLCVGSGDLIGWDPIIITSEMVGQLFAHFVSIECKNVDGMTEAQQRSYLANFKPGTGGKKVQHIREQLAWIDTVRRCGGKAGVALDRAHVRAILQR